MNKQWANRFRLAHAAAMPRREEMMSTQEIVEVVGEFVIDDGKTLEQQHGSQAVAVAQEIQTALAPHVAQNPAYASLWEQFCAAPQAMAPALAGVLQVVLGADAALARRLDTLLAQYQQAKGTPSAVINTGGGAYVGGSVTVREGDFIGRDKVTTTITQGADPEAIARAFKQFYDAVEARPKTPVPEKEDLKAELKEVEQEVAKGEKADEGFLVRRLRNIGRMAPDILEVVLATFANPVAGLGVVAKKIAEKIKGEKEPSA
jgi:hypothetical protein